MKMTSAVIGVVLVDPDEGPRLTTRLEGVPPHEVAIGARVKAQIMGLEDGPLLVFGA